MSSQYSPLSEGGLKKSWMTLAKCFPQCEHSSPFLEEGGPNQVSEVRKEVTRQGVGGSNRVGLVIQTDAARSWPSTEFVRLDVELLPALNPSYMTYSTKDW